MLLPSYLSALCLIPVIFISDKLTAALKAIVLLWPFAPIPGLLIYALTLFFRGDDWLSNVAFQYLWILIFTFTFLPVLFAGSATARWLKASLIIPFITCTAMASDIGQKDTLYLRAATSSEIVGVWSARFFNGSFYKFRYVAITKDGRIGRVVSNTDLAKMTSNSIIKAINDNSVIGGSVVGWKQYYDTNNGIVVAAESGEREEYHTLGILTKDASSGKKVNITAAAEGDLVMQQYYLPPSDWPASAPPPHMLSPAPWVLQRLPE